MRELEAARHKLGFIRVHRGPEIYIPTIEQHLISFFRSYPSRCLHRSPWQRQILGQLATPLDLTQILVRQKESHRQPPVAPKQTR